ncbi:MAG: hypothetical protein ABIG11_04765 [bacterium]
MTLKKGILLLVLVVGLVIPGLTKVKDKGKDKGKGKKKPPVAAEISPVIFYLLGGVPLAVIAWRLRKKQ